MQIALRSLRLLAIIVWLGGLIFFGAVLAPVVFTKLTSTHDAGQIVSAALRILHVGGIICGVVFILTTLLVEVFDFQEQVWRTSKPRYALPCIVATIMIGLSAFSQFWVVRQMEKDRREVGEIDSVPLTHPARVDFERLHVLSERLEEGVLAGGLILVVLLAFEERPQR